MKKLITRTWSRCAECGYKDMGVCCLFFGHKCPECGAVDAARIHSKKVSA